MILAIKIPGPASSQILRIVVKHVIGAGLYPD